LDRSVGTVKLQRRVGCWLGVKAPRQGIVFINVTGNQLAARNQLASFLIAGFLDRAFSHVLGIINVKLWNVIRTDNGNDNFLFSLASFVVINLNRNRIGQLFVFAQMLDFA